MKNLSQIFCVERKKRCVFTLALCLMWAFAPGVEAISVKLRGKIVLGAVLSGLAYGTHALIKRDRRAAEQLQFRLGPPERVVEFERGFDVWRIAYYRNECYLFRNHRFVASVPCADVRSGGGENTRRSRRWCACKFTSPFLIDTPVLAFPRWSRLCLLHLRRVPRFVFSGRYRWGAGRLLVRGR